MGDFLVYRKHLQVAGLASVLLLVQLVPVEFPYYIQSQGQLMPVREWTLSRAANGDLRSSFKDNRTGKLSAYAVTAFQRGNEARFVIDPRVYEKARIQQGDTIATMYSNKDEALLVQLQGDLQVQHYDLLLNQAGAKTEELRGYADRLNLAKQALAMQQKLTGRAEALYRDSLISLQEYEIAANLLRTRELEVKVAEASYQAVATGGKPAQINLIEARKEAIRQQIRQIRNGLRQAPLLAPLSGVPIRKQDLALPNEEVLLSVADQSAYIISFPVRYGEKEYLWPGQTVQVNLTGTTRQCLGKIIGLDNTTQIIDGRQAFFATALITEQELPVVSNTFLRVTVVGQPITLAQYMARGIKSLLVY